MRPITTGRRILFEYLKEIGFVIGDFIENQGWRTMCSLDIKTYPNLVRTFYENLRFGENFVESSVKRKRIIISVEILGNVLEMPFEGTEYLVLKDRTKALQTVLERTEVYDI